VVGSGGGLPEGVRALCFPTLLENFSQTQRKREGRGGGKTAGENSLSPLKLCHARSQANLTGENWQRDSIKIKYQGENRIKGGAIQIGYLQ